MINRWHLVVAIFGVFWVTVPAAQAEVTALEILHRQPYAQGQTFGETGAYEKIAGVARFAVDPQHPRNRAIVDLDKAPRNAKGLVEFAADFYILAPKNPAKGNGAIFYDVNNRGNKLALRFFNNAPGGNNLDKPGSDGDGFLLRRGYTVLWCGWIGELLPGGDRLLLQAPIATDNGKPIRGLVAFEMGTDEPVDSLPISRREGHGSYPPSKAGEAGAVLTWRQRRDDRAMEIPRQQWSLVRQPIAQVKEGVPGTLSQIRLHLSGGFRPGYLYELQYEAEGPIVQGLGFAAVRDLVSFLRYNAKDSPIRRDDGKPAFNRAHGFGVSQSGRFLRHLLYQGFNADEAGRRVFDGLIPHVAGGGLGFFNHRFAQPTRHNGQHEDHDYPCDVFPFTYGPAYDPFLNKEDGILKNVPPAVAPYVIHTQSCAEYWHRSGSLVHTDPRGLKDADIPAKVRIYAFGGTQHGPAGDPPTRSIGDNLNNPGDYRPFLRALLDALDHWVVHKKNPPPSMYPRIADKTLVGPAQRDTGFPTLPGIRYPEVIQCPSANLYGPEFLAKGILATGRPVRCLGHYDVLVPKSGPDGNDLGTLLPPEVAVPLATYTGWNLRRREVGAETMLASLLGSYIPFAKTRAERLQTGDPRPSIAERYATFQNYHKRFQEACAGMVKQGYLLREDADRLVKEREKVRGLFPE